MSFVGKLAIATVCSVTIASLHFLAHLFNYSVPQVTVVVFVASFVAVVIS